MANNNTTLFAVDAAGEKGGIGTNYIFKEVIMPVVIGRIVVPLRTEIYVLSVFSTDRDLIVFRLIWRFLIGICIDDKG